MEEASGDILKFGKKIAYGKKQTNEEVLESHLLQMREKLDSAKQEKE